MLLDDDDDAADIAPPPVEPPPLAADDSDMDALASQLPAKNKAKLVVLLTNRAAAKAV